MNILTFIKERWYLIAVFILAIALLFMLSFFVIVPLFHGDLRYNLSLSDIFYTHEESSARSNYFVGISGQNFPPLIVYDGNVPTGFDIDLITWVANDAKINITFVPMTSIENAFNALRYGEIDMLISGLSITPKRMEEFLFSIPYHSSEQKIAVRNESELTLHDFYVGHGLIGVIRGTHNYNVVHELFFERDSADPSRLLEIDGHTQVIYDLLSGEIDFMVTDQQHMEALVQKYPLKIIGSISTGEKFGIVFSKNNVALQKMVDTSLMNLFNSPEWDAIMQKYFPGQIVHKHEYILG